MTTAIAHKLTHLNRDSIKPILLELIVGSDIVPYHNLS